MLLCHIYRVIPPKYERLLLEYLGQRCKIMQKFKFLPSKLVLFLHFWKISQCMMITRLEVNNQLLVLYCPVRGPSIYIAVSIIYYRLDLVLRMRYLALWETFLWPNQNWSKKVVYLYSCPYLMKILMIHSNYRWDQFFIILFCSTALPSHVIQGLPSKSWVYLRGVKSIGKESIFFLTFQTVALFSPE